MPGAALSDLSFVVTCMGRLAHLRESLPRLATFAPARIVVVDWTCPERAGDWVDATHPGCTVVRVRDRSRFNLAGARNAGAAAVTTTWICFIDVDVLAAPGLKDLLPMLADDAYYVAEPSTTSLRGTVLSPRAAFERTGGYDEVIAGWGSEDTDFYRRLELAGYARRGFDAALLAALPHEDALRTRHYDEPDPVRSVRLNAYYMHAKLDLMKLTGSPLSLPARRALRARLEAQVQSAQTSGVGTGLELPVGRQSFSEDWELRASLRYELVPRGRTSS